MEEKKNIENFNRELLAKYLNNEVSSREKLEVESWLNQSEKNREEMEESRQLLDKVDAMYKAKNFDSNAAWTNVHSKMNPPQLTIIQHKKRRKEAIARFYKYAAIVVIAILLGSVGYYIGLQNKTNAIFTEIVSAENQVLNEYILPDGSVVALNSNSKLTFPKQFSDNVREVSIEGEAFFDVTPNPEKPFIINAGKAQVKVLGTSFDVCAYPDLETVEVVVKTGKVQVLNKNNQSVSANNEVYLMPGEKGTLFNESNVLEKKINDNLNFLAWKTQDIIFNEVPLKDVIQCLEKVYHVDINLSDAALNNLLYTGHFDKKPVNFILDVVRLTFNLELSEENKLFVLSSRKNEQVKL